MCPKILHTFQGRQPAKAIPGNAVTRSAGVEGRAPITNPTGRWNVAWVEGATRKYFDKEVTERMRRESLKPTGEKCGHRQSSFP
jgi:hypothetical protein